MEECIQGIEGQFDDPAAYEIIVADNSTDPGFRLCDDFTAVHPRVTLIQISENRGWVDALNIIIPGIGGEYAVIMHPDVEFTPGCVAGMKAHLDAHPEVGVVAPNLYYPDGSENAVRLLFPSVSVEFRRIFNKITHILTKRKFVVDERLWDHVDDVTVDMVMSVCFMIRSELIQRVAPINPKLWTYYANDCLCARVRDLGFTCKYLAGIRAIHWERFSDTRLYSAKKESEYKSNAIPAAARMEGDRFVFLKEFYSPTAVFAFRALALIEYLLLLLSQVRQPRETRARQSQQIRAAMGAVMRA